MRFYCWLSSSLIAFSAPLTAQSGPTTGSPPGRDIVVTGVPLKTSEAQLRQCLARKCPPNEDIAATLAHAENAFVAGEYRMARNTLQSSISRNKRYAKTMPVEVAGLFRANSRVALHLGEKNASVSNAIATVDALTAGLPKNDARVLDARIEVGDIFANTDRIANAIVMYREIAHEAHRYDLPLTEGYARLRLAALYTAKSETSYGYRVAAKKEIDTLISNPDPRAASFAAAGQILRAKAAVKDGDRAAIDRLIADYKLSVAAPLLLYSPQIKQPPSTPPALTGVGQDIIKPNTLDRMLMVNVDKQWVDIGFWITPDGKVSDVDTLRESPKLSGKWVKPITDAIAGRRYAPFTSEAGKNGIMRVERYTLTSFWENDASGTRLPVRSPIPRIEMLDLTL